MPLLNLNYCTMDARFYKRFPFKSFETVDAKYCMQTIILKLIGGSYRRTLFFNTIRIIKGLFSSTQSLTIIHSSLARPEIQVSITPGLLVRCLHTIALPTLG